MIDEPCPWRVRQTDQVSDTYLPCKNCGHTMLVHAGAHNPGLMECVICTVLVTAIRLAERESPVIQLKVTQDEQDRLVKDMALMRHRHDPLDHTGGREKPSETVRRLQCMVCDDWLVPSDDEKHWVHEP